MHWLGLAAVSSLLGCFFTLIHPHWPWSLPAFAPAVEEQSVGTLLLDLGDLSTASDAELAASLLALQAEKQKRAQREKPRQVVDTKLAPNDSAVFRYAHKKTYATADPIAAAYFMEDYFGAKADRSQYQHHCDNTDALQQPFTKNANFPATADQPRGFTIHFVKNPQKAPGQSKMNASELGLWVEKWRGNFGATEKFDQFMDSHLGLVFDSLDPLVERWDADGIPYICRTWCCGPGMPQWPLHCPKDERLNTFFCEQGCYVEAPHGIIVEALCGLESYKASRQCLTKIKPEKLKIFDLCTDS